MTDVTLSGSRAGVDVDRSIGNESSLPTPGRKDAHRSVDGDPCLRAAATMHAGSARRIAGTCNHAIPAIESETASVDRSIHRHYWTEAVCSDPIFSIMEKCIREEK
jgi:hypothetical protein